MKQGHTSKNILWIFLRTLSTVASAPSVSLSSLFNSARDLQLKRNWQQLEAKKKYLSITIKFSLFVCHTYNNAKHLHQAYGNRMIAATKTYKDKLQVQRPWKWIWTNNRYHFPMHLYLKNTWISTHIYCQEIKLNI